MLHLKEDAGEFLSESSLKELIHRYSEFITFPIFQLVEKEEEVEVEDDEEEVGDEDAGEWRDGENQTTRDALCTLVPTLRPDPNISCARFLGFAVVFGRVVG